MDQSLFNDALIFARDAHNGVTRKKSSVPFLIHPMEVATIVATISESQELLAAALLHDTVEDAEVSLEEIKERFGEKVYELVKSETEDKHRDMLPEDSWQLRKEESLEELKNSNSLEIKILWLADKLANMRSFYRAYIKKGSSLWEDYHQKDPSKQAWYYRKVLEYTNELSETMAYKELEQLVNLVFKGE